MYATTPPNVINITGPETLRVQGIAKEFGERLGKGVRFDGTESSDALLSDAHKAFELFGRPGCDGPTNGRLDRRLA